MLMALYKQKNERPQSMRHGDEKSKTGGQGRRGEERKLDYYMTFI